MDENPSTISASSPIGVFDSGVGGLTVLKILAEKFPQENFIYFGDTARVPYGTKSPETIRRYSIEAMNFLANQGVKAIIIACNSASSQVPEKIFRDVVVETVIEPGATAALEVTEGKIGILATRATVNSRTYETVLESLSQKISKKIQVFQAAAPLLVPLAEEGWIDDPITNLIAFRYVQPLVQKGIDTIILGCTHYPILRGAIQKAAGASVKLIDSGESLSQILKEKMNRAEILENTENSNRSILLYSSDESTQFKRMAEQILQPIEFSTNNRIHP